MHVIKNIKGIMHHKKTNAIGVFLMAMMIMTVLSRFADSVMIPRVTVCSVQDMKLEYPVEIEGRIKTEGEQAVYCIENLRIAHVFAEKNDLVKKKDPLFSVDMEDLEIKIAQMEQEIRACEIGIAEIENTYQEQVKQQERNLNRAKEDYADILNATQQELDLLYRQMEEARIELERYSALQPQGAYLEDAAKNEEQKEQTDTQRREELEQKYEEKQRLYQETAASREEALKNAVRQMEDAGTSITKSSSAALQQMEQEKIETSLQQLYHLREENGYVCSAFEGRILECGISTGSITSLDPVFVMEDFSQPFQFEGFIEESASIHVAEGMEGVLEMEREGVVLEGVKISRVTEAEEGSCRVIARLAAESVKKTGNAVLSFTRESKRYANCIPRSSLYNGSFGYYFIKVTEEDTVLGRQLRAEYVSVNLIECNDEFAAVYGNVSEHDKIVVRASKGIKEGDRIRITEE